MTIFLREVVWYSQVKIEGRHLFDELSPGISSVEQLGSAKYLDYLFDELKRLDS